MEFVRMGISGLKLTEITFGSALTIGTEHKDIEFAQEMIDTAWATGIRSFDVSNNYGMGEAEHLVAQALRKYPREEYVIATKGSWPLGESVYHKGLSRKHILWALEMSLQRMQLPYVDIYYAHRYDPEVSMEEIVRTFNILIQSGKIRYWATSEWPLEALEKCHEVCDRLNMEKPIIEQFIYSYAVRKSERNGVKNFCDIKGVGSMGFSPLCQGLLTGKYREGRVPENSRIAKSTLLGYDKTKNFYTQNQSVIDYFISICEKYAIKGNHLALLWCLRKKIYPVVGASSPEQLYENVTGLHRLVDERVWNELDIEVERFS